MIVLCQVGTICVLRVKSHGSSSCLSMIPVKTHYHT